MEDHHLDNISNNLHIQHNRDHTLLTIPIHHKAAINKDLHLQDPMDIIIHHHTKATVTHPHHLNKPLAFPLPYHHPATIPTPPSYRAMPLMTPTPSVPP